MHCNTWYLPCEILERHLSALLLLDATNAGIYLSATPLVEEERALCFLIEEAS
jgi:hypothetical protein